MAVALLFTTNLGAQPWRALVVARPPGAEVFSTAPVQARVRERVSLATVLVDARGQLRGPPVPVRLGARVMTPRPLPEGSVTRWLRVVPRMEHVDTPPPNPGVPSFSNAVLFGPRHGRWIGYDRLEYETREVAPSDASIAPDGLLSLDESALPSPHDGAGSMWFSAAVTLPDGLVVRAPDGASVDRLGLSRSVARVSFRSDDSYLGWLSTYFGVPNVFGSNGAGGDHQSDRYTGADCADVLVGAMRARGVRSIPYLSVAQIGEATRRLTGVLVLDASGQVRTRAARPVTLRWGEDVLPGDLVTLGYQSDPENSLPRAWDHIGALVRDENRDGVLDGADILRHMGGRGLEDTHVLHGGPMQIALWRWRARAE
jgi:hypothetical protein